MRVTEIPKVLNLALAARKQGLNFIPLFAGDAGIGKSEICQAWAKGQSEFGFIDCRLAYYEAPDMVGLPHIVSGTTFFATPELWPTSGSGLLLLEEPNRANTSVLNTVMQLLTDRKIGKYTLPEGWIIAAVINPDNSNYDVNRMDTALKDRFACYEVLYDKETFVKFMREHQWNNHIISFVESGTWVYKRPDEIGDQGQYIAPRTFSRLNSAKFCNIDSDMELHYDTSVAVLGKLIGKEFHTYVTELKPVLYSDWLADKDKAIEKIEKYASGDYRGDILNVTIQSFINDENVNKKDAIELALLLPADLAYSLIYKMMMLDKISATDLGKNAKLKKLLSTVKEEKKNE